MLLLPVILIDPRLMMSVINVAVSVAEITSSSVAALLSPLFWRSTPSMLTFCPVNEMFPSLIILPEVRARVNVPEVAPMMMLVMLVLFSPMVLSMVTLFRPVMVRERLSILLVP